MKENKKKEKTKEKAAAAEKNSTDANADGKPAEGKTTLPAPDHGENMAAVTGPTFENNSQATLRYAHWIIPN